MRTPEQLLEHGLRSARVVMLNEAHNGELRCVRTRRVGQRLVPLAQRLGVRYLAMEALYPEAVVYANAQRRLPDDAPGYLAQPEMREFVHTALDHGWTLLAYEADPVPWLEQRTGQRIPSEGTVEQRIDVFAAHQHLLQSQAYTNWREQQQAQNLVAALRELPPAAGMLVWCGNGHLSKRASGDWTPMGVHFEQLSPWPAFAIDQIVTVQFDVRPQSKLQALVARFRPRRRNKAQLLVARYRSELEACGGTAGFLAGEQPRDVPWFHAADAVLLSLDNAME